MSNVAACDDKGFVHQPFPFLASILRSSALLGRWIWGQHFLSAHAEGAVQTAPLLRRLHNFTRQPDNHALGNPRRHKLRRRQSFSAQASNCRRFGMSLCGRDHLTMTVRSQLLLKLLHEACWWTLGIVTLPSSRHLAACEWRPRSHTLQQVFAFLQALLNSRLLLVHGCQQPLLGLGNDHDLYYMRRMSSARFVLKGGPILHELLTHLDVCVLLGFSHFHMARKLRQCLLPILVCKCSKLEPQLLAGMFSVVPCCSKSSGMTTSSWQGKPCLDPRKIICMVLWLCSDMAKARESTTRRNPQRSFGNCGPTSLCVPEAVGIMARRSGMAVDVVAIAVAPTPSEAIGCDLRSLRSLLRASHLDTFARRFFAKACGSHNLRKPRCFHGPEPEPPRCEDLSFWEACQAWVTATVSERVPPPVTRWGDRHGREVCCGRSLRDTLAVSWQSTLVLLVP